MELLYMWIVTGILSVFIAIASDYFYGIGYVTIGDLMIASVFGLLGPIGLIIVVIGCLWEIAARADGSWLYKKVFVRKGKWWNS